MMFCVLPVIWYVQDKSEMVIGYSMSQLPKNMIYCTSQPQNNSFETDHDDWIAFDVEVRYDL